MSESESSPTPPGTPARPRVRRQLRPANEVRLRRRRLITYALLAGAGVLMVNALLGENGYVATVGAQREYAELNAALAAEIRTTDELRDRIYRMRTDPKALEEEARRQLGLIRPGETLVILRDVKPGAGSAEK